MTHSSLPPHTWRIAMVVFATIMVVGVGVGGAVAKWSQSASVSVQVSIAAAPNPDVCSIVKKAPPSSVPAWNSGRFYDPGAQVVHDGLLFSAVWGSAGEVPRPDATGAWQEISTNVDGTVLWTLSREFRAEERGTVVCYEGMRWRVWDWSRGQAPNPSVVAAWEELLTHADGRPIWTMTRHFQPGDVVHHKGRLWKATLNHNGRGPGVEPGTVAWAWVPYTG